jgi:DHA1 family bicyclomycin/chloramphenicol resistance-like MFS transporter
MRRLQLINLLFALVIALPFAMDIYVPALPDMAGYFSVTPAAMQLTLTLFMFSASLMQLIIGPLSDQAGRKPILLLSIGLFGIGSVLCATSYSLASLVIYRMIQAAGCCGMMALAFAVVRDVAEGKESAIIYAYLNGIVSFSPIFAPFIGSFLDIYFGWRATFIALLVIVTWAFISIGGFLPETLEKRKPFNFTIFKEYWDIFQHPRFFYYTLISAIGVSYFYLFCSMSPYIIITVLHLPKSHYGYYFCFMGTSLLLGSFLAGKVVEHYGVYRTCLIGVILSLLGGVIMLAWHMVSGLSIANFIWPMLIIGVGGAFQLGMGTAGLMEPFQDTAGAAAGLGGALRFAFMATAGAVFIRKNIDSTLPLSLAAVGFSLLALLIMLKKKNDLL